MVWMPTFREVYARDGNWDIYVETKYVTTIWIS